MHIAGALVLALSAGCCLQAGLSSLTVSSSDAVFHIPLTDRQTEILREQGLPESYEELTVRQKFMLLSVDDLLGRLEEKYHKKMIFISYQEGTPDNPDRMCLRFRDPDWDDEIPDAAMTRTETDGIISYSDDYEQAAEENL